MTPIRTARITSTALAAMLTLALAPQRARAQGAVRARLDWAELARQGRVKSGEVSGGDLVLRGGGAPMLVVELERPAITSGRYALRGAVSCEGLPAQAMLEMWSYFDDGAYFTRTLGIGLLAPLSGTQAPRAMMLPFDAKASRAPVRLVLNLYAPAEGAVRLGPLELVEYPSSEALWAELGVAAPDSGRLLGWVGGVYGSLLGVLGAILGVLAQRGRGRRLAAALAWGTVILSGLAAIAAPLLIGSLLLAAIFAGGALLVGAVWLSVGRRFEAAELRRMHALDAPLS